MKKVRHCDKEYDLARLAALRHLVPTAPINIANIERAAYVHGYAQALMDVADKKVKVPKPDLRNS